MESDWSYWVWQYGLTQLGYTKCSRLLAPTWLYVAGHPDGPGYAFYLWKVPGDNQMVAYEPFGTLVIGGVHFPGPFEVDPDLHW